jgi:hypothetical protein
MTNIELADIKYLVNNADACKLVAVEDGGVDFNRDSILPKVGVAIRIEAESFPNCLLNRLQLH